MRLKEIRVQNNLTQKNVADYIGCSPTVYSRYEGEKRKLSIDMLIKLSQFFDVSIDYIVGNKIETSNLLSNYELNLINAAKEADKRAREDALLILKNHRKNEK